MTTRSAPVGGGARVRAPPQRPPRTGSSRKRDRYDMYRRYLRGNGEILHARYSVSAIRDRSGRFQCAMVIVQDVTIQVTADQALRAREERYRLALEATNDGIWDWDIPMDHPLVNARWLARFGYGPTEVPDMGAALALLHPGDRPTFLEKLRAALEGGASLFEYEHRLATRQGEWRWVVTRGRVVSRDENGKPLRAIGSQTDVTQLKLIQANLHLADRLATVGTLASGVAHEINNPLAYVMANVEFAREALVRLSTSADAGAAGNPTWPRSGAPSMTPGMAAAASR